MIASLPLADLGVPTLAIIILAFFVGGISKGVTGMGLHLVAVPVMASTIDPRIAIAMMLVPSVTANTWMVIRGGRFREVLERFWPLLLCMVIFTLIGVQLLVRVDAKVASLLLGAAVMLFCLTQVFPLKLHVSQRHERWAGPAAGTVAGLMGGTTNFFSPPLAAYLVALKLPKDLFVAAITFFFLVTAAPLQGSLAVSGILTLEILAASAIAAIVVQAGVFAGSVIRGLVSQRTFQRTLVAVLLLIAFNLVRRGLF